MLTRFPVLALVVLALAFAAVGCGAGADENPITPEKMSEMRKKENEARSGAGGAANAAPRTQ